MTAPSRRGRRRGSSASLTTRGRCLLAGGLATMACAVLLDERDLLRVGVFVTALPLLAIVLTGLSRAGVRGARSVEPPRLPVGEATSVRLVVRRPGTAWLRMPWLGELLITDEVPGPASTSGPGSPAFRITRAPRAAPAELRYTVRPAERGRHLIGPLTARGADPLGVATFEREIAARSELLVLPAIVPLRGLPASLGADLLDTQAARRQHGPGTVDLTVREYRQGDELRRVHWRSTAHRDELMVRVEERARRGKVTIMLDRRRSAHRGNGPTASLEWAVSMAASAFLHLHAMGMAVTVVTADGVVLAPGAPAAAMLDALADLQPTSTQTLDGPALPGAGADAVVAVLGAADPEDAASLARRMPTPAGHAVLLDLTGWGATADVPEAGPLGDLAAASETLRGAGWSVAVAPVGTPVDEAWATLRATSPVPT